MDQDVWNELILGRPATWCNSLRQTPRHSPLCPTPPSQLPLRRLPRHRSQAPAPLRLAPVHRYATRRGLQTGERSGCARLQSLAPHLRRAPRGLAGAGVDESRRLRRRRLCGRHSLRPRATRAVAVTDRADARRRAPAATRATGRCGRGRGRQVITRGQRGARPPFRRLSMLVPSLCARRRQRRVQRPAVRPAQCAESDWLYGAGAPRSTLTSNLAVAKMSHSHTHTDACACRSAHACIVFRPVSCLSPSSIVDVREGRCAASLRSGGSSLRPEVNGHSH